MIRFIVLICLAMCSSTLALAQSVTTFWGGAYPQTQECGPAVAAMGGAGAALPGELGASLLNPATLTGKSTPKGWSVILDGTYSQAYFRQDAIVARRWYVAKTGQTVLDSMIGKDSTNTRMIPGYLSAAYHTDRWAVALVVNRNLSYNMPYAQGTISVTFLRPVWSRGYSIIPEVGSGNIQEEQYALMGALRASDSVSIGVGAIYVRDDVSITNTFFDPDYLHVQVGKAGNWASASRIVPLLGILWQGKNWSTGLSYEGGYSIPMNVQILSFNSFSKLDGEYRRPPRASLGLAFTSGHVQASAQVDYLWSQLETSHLSPFYPAAWFRTNNGHAYHFGLRFSDFKGLGRTQFMVGVSYTRNDGLYYLPGATAQLPKGPDPMYNVFLDYNLSLRYPMHHPVTTVSCGANIDLGKHFSLIPEIQASTFSKVARLGIAVSF
jgi:hypothetical protein